MLGARKQVVTQRKGTIIAEPLVERVYCYMLFTLPLLWIYNRNCYLGAKMYVKLVWMWASEVIYRQEKRLEKALIFEYQEHDQIYAAWNL